MTDVHTVAVLDEGGTVIFLGHFVLALACPVCAAWYGMDLRQTRCPDPREHARVLADQYREMSGMEVRTLSTSYRSAPGPYLWRRVNAKVEQELGVKA